MCDAGLSMVDSRLWEVLGSKGRPVGSTSSMSYSFRNSSICFLLRMIFW